MVDAPEKIRVAQDSDGFWTCREAVSGSQEYVRADLVAELEALAERLKHEAVFHAQEARTANATIAEIYREVSGGKGEPGNWNGAEPVRRELTALRARVAELEAALTYARDEYDQMIWGEDYEYRKAGERVQEIIHDANRGNNPWKTHVDFENLHPFVDGNGRTGRAIWAWHMKRLGRNPFSLGFLHRFYYQTLENSDARKKVEG